jgi:hypothetical protein
MKREIEMKALTKEMSTQTDFDYQLSCADYFIHYIYPQDTFFYIDPHGLVLLTAGGINYTFPLPSPRKVENGKKNADTETILQNKDVKTYAANTELYLWARGQDEKQIINTVRRNTL